MSDEGGPHGAPPKLVLVSEGTELATPLRAGPREVWRWANEESAEARDGDHHFAGDPTDPATYAWMRDARAVTAVVNIEDSGRALAIVDAMRAVRADAAVLIMTDGVADAPGDGTLVRCGGLRDVLRIDLEDELQRLEAERRVYCLRAFGAGPGAVPILVHPDPDPDAVSSAFAVRALLDRTAEDMPIVTTRAITRPENRRMSDLLGVRIVEVTEEELRAFDRIIAVDMQPTGLCTAASEVRVAVLDHHPAEAGCRAELYDVRPHLGATATMLTQYFRALDGARIGVPLATALLFGIKTDTDGLMRKVAAEDVAAYAFLQERADLAMLRRFERPAYPQDAARAFGAALTELRIRGDVAVAFAGELSPEASHILADLGDFCIGVEMVCWALAAGYVEEELVVSIRHMGRPPGAGALARALAHDRGKGGGHETMARFSVPRGRSREWLGDDVAGGLVERARAALDSLDQSSTDSPSSSGPMP